MKDNVERLANYKKKYQYKWVARDKSSGKILGSDDKLGSLVSRIRRAANTYVVESVVPLNVTYIP